MEDSILVHPLVEGWQGPSGILVKNAPSGRVGDARVTLVESSHLADGKNRLTEAERISQGQQEGPVIRQ